MEIRHMWKRLVNKRLLDSFAIKVYITGNKLYNRWVKGSPVEDFTIKASTTGKQLYNQRVKGSPVEAFAIRTTNSTKNFIRRSYINWRTKGIANKILNIKVKNQFDQTVPCTIGDICIMGHITESEILDIAKSYGIKFPSEAIDFSENNILKYLYYHGQNCQFTFHTASGEKVISGITQMPDNLDLTTLDTPLIPKDHLDSLIAMFHGNNEIWNSVYGHSAEYAIKDRLHDLGYQVEMPSNSNYQATDLFVEKQFFSDRGLQYTESPDLPGFGLLQVKSTSELLPTNNFTANTLHHLEINPDIPVICSSKIANTIGDCYPSQMISFSDIGINDTQLENTLYNQYMQLKFFNPETLDCLNGVAYGLDASVFSDAMDSARTSVFSHSLNDSGVMESSLNIGFHNIPLIGMAVRGALTLQNNLEKVKRHEMSLDAAYANTARVIAKTAVVGTASTIGTGVVLGAMGTSLGAQFNGLSEALSDDNIGDIATSAAGAFGALVIALGIGKIASAIYDKFFDKTKELKRKLHLQNESAANIAIFITTKLKGSDFLSQFIQPVNKLKDTIDKINLKIDHLKRRNDIYPISYYVAKRKLQFLTPTYKRLKRNYEKIFYMWNYLTAASSYLSLPLDASKESKKSLKKTTIFAYIDYNSNRKIKKILKKSTNSDENFSNTIMALIDYDINNFIPYIKKIKNDELNKLIAIYEEKKIIVQNEKDKLRQEGVTV